LKVDQEVIMVALLNFLFGINKLYTLSFERMLVFLEIFSGLRLRRNPEKISKKKKKWYNYKMLELVKVLIP